MRFSYSRLTPGELATGRPLAFGDVVDLTRHEQRANARLIDSGRLLPLPRRNHKPTNQETFK